MEYRTLGRSGLKVSLLGLGGNNFGRQVDAETTAAIVDKCVDLGITFFDGADVYGNRGGGEQALGAALKPHRRNIVLSTKSGGAMGEGPYFAGASRRYLMDALDASLRRLQTDYVDLYYIHFPDPKRRTSRRSRTWRPSPSSTGTRSSSLPSAGWPPSPS